jgi:hypothetical protein
MRKLTLLLLVPLAGISAHSGGPPPPHLAATQPARASTWYRGNTHTHTSLSDGDSAPEDVVAWYKEHGYAFLVLTDHNVLSAVDTLNTRFGVPGRFLVMKGEEVTDRFGEKPIHVNGLDVERLVPPQGGTSVVDVIQRNVNAIRSARGVPHINHPNFRWAISQEELKQIDNNRLFEIYNGHPQVNNQGGGGVPGLEEVWDAILSSGRLIYGIAVDDAHHFKRPWDRLAARPGRGWVMVRAARLAPDAILEAMERGDFYASTGVELSDWIVTPTSVKVDVRETHYSAYRIQFIGRDGRLLLEVPRDSATYQIRGDEGYVRARIIESNGDLAWTQPVIVRK